MRIRAGVLSAYDTAVDPSIRGIRGALHRRNGDLVVSAEDAAARRGRTSFSRSAPGLESETSSFQL